MIDHALEWMGNHPGVEVALIVLLSVLLPAALVLISRMRCPDITMRYEPRRRKWRDRDEHADHLGI